MKKLYIGMDVHKKYTVAVAMNENGKVVGRDRISHGSSIAQAPWEEFFERFPIRPEVALEATGVSYPVLEAIEEHCASVVVSNPLKTRLIAEQMVKTDKIDATAIANLLRSSFLPTIHVAPRDIREQRELLRHRLSLVRLQTGIKNRMHGMLTRCGEVYNGSDMYGKSGREYLAQLPLRPVYRQELDRYLRVLDNIAGEIKILTKLIHKDVEVTPEALRLTTIPGIGKYLAATIYWEIGDIERFLSPSKLVGYCGLGPRVHSTGGKTFYGPITKQGNKFLRWALVEATQKYGKRSGPLGEFFRRVQFKKGSKSARVAAARKLATIIWHMLKKQENFDEHKMARDRMKCTTNLDEVALSAPDR